MEVGEGDLGLDHPELGQVPGGVGVLGPEGRPERVHPAHGQAVGLDVELARDGEVGLPTEEVLGEVDPTAVRPGAGKVGQVQRRDPEHGTGPLGVVGGDDRRVDPVEPPLVEEPLERHRQAVPHPGDGAERVRPGPQVGDLPQVLERVLLGRHRVGLGIADPADDLHGLGLDLHRLALALRLRQLPRHDHRAAGREPRHLALEVRERRPGHHLDRVEARPVVHGEERQSPARLRVPAVADPTLDHDRRPDRHPAGQGVHHRHCGDRHWSRSASSFCTT